ncbi:hypothetical protein AAFP30_22120 [Gordonia sp. CPCC 205515]|uniref:hypothetical protein n=1 Tax=Gordonia sp. CPCC 205515 TaxID=3140791 RepID=UPI003AF3A224
MRGDFIRIYWPVLVALPLYGLMVLFTFGHTPDDGLITLRYAENLLASGQPDFTVGQPVEGFSSPLHLLVATASALAPDSYTVLVLKLFGVLFGAAALWTTAVLARTVGLSTKGQAACTVLVALSWNFAASAANGLETSLYAVLFTGLLAALIRSDAPRWQAPVWAALFVLARPESLAVVAVLAAGCAVLRTQEPLGRRVQWVLAPIVTYLVLAIARYSYFGELLPNTYYAKNVPFGIAAPLGSDYLVQAQAWWGFVPALSSVALLIELILTIVAIAPWWRTHRSALLLQLAILIQAAMIIMAGGDWMYGGRHLAPIIPLLTVASVAGAAHLVGLITTDRRTTTASASSRRGVVIAATSVAAVALAVAFVGPTQNTYHPVWNIAGADNTGLIKSGGYDMYSVHWIEGVRQTRCLPPGTVVAFSEMGLFGLSNTHLDIVDTRGLVSGEIAHAAGSDIKMRTGVEDPRWAEPDSVVGSALLERNPALILVAAPTSPAPTVLGGRYTLINQYATPGDPVVLATYTRTDQPTEIC